MGCPADCNIQDRFSVNIHLLIAGLNGNLAQYRVNFGEICRLKPREDPP